MAKTLPIKLNEVKELYRYIADIATCIKNHTIYDSKPYVELEYIQSTGTQYINTGISANSCMGVEIDWQLTATSGTIALFGARSGGTSGRFSCINYSNKFHFMVGSGDTWNVAINTNRHSGYVKVSSNYSWTGKFDNTTYSGTTTSAVLVNKNFYIFHNDYDSKCSMKLYSCKLFNAAGTLIRDFIPVRRKEDNAICLYDKVTEQFYLNKGTGVFIAGPEK